MNKLIILLCGIFVASCARNTRLPNNNFGVATCTCNPIYGRASDWDIISDELARNIYKHNKWCENIN